MNLAFKLTSITALVLCACSSNSGDGASSGGASNTGGSGLTGGSSNGGGSARGGASNGGASNGGGSSGGVANGGASNGGASNGGASNGGASNGGASNDKDGGTNSGLDSGTNADGSAGNTPGACCTASTVPGCNDTAVQDCVCKQDPRCCSEKWNDVCVALVNGLACGKMCPTNDCCTASTSGGCSDTTVQDCVCAKSPDCCQKAWDAVCVLLVPKNVLGSTCGTCN